MIVDFSLSGIWGKLGTGVRDIPLNSSAKFPPNPTVIFLALRSDPLFLDLVMQCITIFLL